MKAPNITYTKAVAIILMVLCHSAIGNKYVFDFIYMFHMPLFFFFSGFCLKTEYFGLPWKFAWKRVKGIYWPYLKWSVVFLLLHNMMFGINLYSAEYGYNGNGSQLYSQNDFFERFRSIVFLMQGHEQLLGGYWFMRALFFGSLIAFVLLWLLNIANKKTKTPRAYPIVIGGGTLLVFCVALNFYHRILLYIISPQLMLAAVFFLIGHAFRQLNVSKFSVWQLLAALVLVFIGSFFWNMATDSPFYESRRILPYILTAVLGTWAIYSLPWHRIQGRITAILQFIGNNTLTILTWHFLMFKFVSLIIIYTYGLPIARLAEFPAIREYAVQGWWVAYFLTAILTTCAIAYCNRWIKNSWMKL